MSPTPDPRASRPLTTRLKLTMPSPTHAANLEELAASEAIEANLRRPSYSPVTPPYSGGTPDAATERDNQPDFMDEPDPVSVTLEENSDATALKAALSILQLQKQQSQRDIKQLNKMKAAANEEPEAFVDALKAGKLSRAHPQAVLNEGDNDERKPDNGVSDSEKLAYDFGQFPNPQNIVRCPPINWAKYHIVGESLDKLHEDQRQRPEPGTVRRDEYGRAPEHVVAAPYRPFVDHLETTTGAIRRESKD